jgi:hypothetical protein
MESTAFEYLVLDYTQNESMLDKVGSMGWRLVTIHGNKMFFIKAIQKKKITTEDDVIIVNENGESFEEMKRG